MFTLPDAVLVLKHYLLDLFDRLQLPCQPTALEAGTTMEEKLHCTNDRVTEIMSHPEAQLLVYVLLIMKLIDDGDLKNVSQLLKP